MFPNQLNVFSLCCKERNVAAWHSSPDQHFMIVQKLSRNVAMLPVVNICKIRFQLVRFRYWSKTPLLAVTVIQRICSFIFILVFFVVMLPHQLLLFPTCLNVSKAWKHCTVLQEEWHYFPWYYFKRNFTMIEIFGMSLVMLSVFSIGLHKGRAQLSLPWPEGGLPSVPRPPPALSPWESLRKAAWASEGCKLLFKYYEQSHIYVWFIRDSEPLRQNWCGK